MKNKQAILTLSFDDCYKDTLKNTLPILSEHKLVATYNAIVGLLGKKEKNLELASFTDLKQAQSQGMEIASHSTNHLPLAKSNKIKKYLKSFLQVSNKKEYLLKAGFNILNSPRQINIQSLARLYKKEVVDSKKNLVDKGFKINSFVYPYGEYDKKVRELVKKHYLSARSTNRGLNDLSETNLYELKICMWNKWTSLTEANKWVDKAIREKKWLIEVFHLVSDENKTDYEYFTSVINLKNHLKYIASKKIRIVTQEKGIEYAAKSNQKK